MDDPQQDPQRLLADLAAEYERSRRFLKQLESSFAREPFADACSGPTCTPNVDGGPEEGDAGPRQNTGLAAHRTSTAFVPSQPESSPSLRAKLRSFFTRRAPDPVRKDMSEPGFTTAVVRTASESQSTVSARSLQQPAGAAERPATASTARRSSMVYYATSTTELPRGQRATGADGGRPATARRSSIVHFGGEAMDNAAQGWVARVAGGELGAMPPERPATARRASLVYYGAAGADTAADTGRGSSSRFSLDSVVAATSASATTGSPAERPATARRASIVQFGDTVAAPGGGLYGYGAVPSGGGTAAADNEQPSFRNGGDVSSSGAIGAAKRGPSVHFSNNCVVVGGGGGGSGGGSSVSGGTLQDTTDPHEFMAAMAGTRRTHSFHQRSGAALTPSLGTRLRGSTSARRNSIDAYYSGRDSCNSPQSQQQQQQQQQQQSSRSSLDVHRALLAPAPAEQIASPTCRTVSSTDQPRPFSAIPRAQQCSNATAVAGGSAAVPVNVSSSALFTPAVLSGSIAGAVALAAAAAGTGGGGAVGRVEVPPSPQFAAVTAPPPSPPPPPRAQIPQVEGQAPAQPLRMQQPPAVGAAWASTAGALSPTSSLGSAGPTSPADATAVLFASRSRIFAAGGGAALRSSLSSSAKRLLDHCEAMPPSALAGTAAAGPAVGGAAGAAAAAASQFTGGSDGGGIAAAGVREHGKSSPGMLDMPSAQAGLAPAQAFARVAPSSLRIAVGIGLAEDHVGEISSPATAVASPAGPTLVTRSAGSCSRLVTPSPPPMPPAQPQQSASPSPSASLPSPLLQPHPPPHPHRSPPPKALSIFRLRGAAGGLMTADGAFAGGAGDSSDDDEEGGGGGAGKALHAERHVQHPVRVDERARSVAGF